MGAGMLKALFVEAVPAHCPLLTAPCSLLPAHLFDLTFASPIGYLLTQ